MPGKRVSPAFSLAMRFCLISSFTLRPPAGDTRRSSPNVLGRAIEVQLPRRLSHRRHKAARGRWWLSGRLLEEVGNRAVEAGQNVFAVEPAVRRHLARGGR